MSRLRTVFMGSPEFAVPALDVCHAETELVFVVTQPDRPTGRGQRVTAPPVKRRAVELGRDVTQPRKVRDGVLAAQIHGANIDLAIVVAYGRILPVDVLNAPRHGCINIHASLLPRWRGAAPIQRAILAGDAQTGVCIMQMDAGLDTGPVHMRRATDIEPLETAGALSARLALLGAEALADFLALFPPATPPQVQASEGMTVAAKLGKEEGRVRWTETASRVTDHVRGMDPWPGAWTVAAEDGERASVPTPGIHAAPDSADRRTRLFGARPSVMADSVAAATDAQPGAVLGVDADGMHVRCGDGVVCISEVQGPGRARMSAQSWASGAREGRPRRWA